MDKALRVDYEKEGDLLEIFFGPPRSSVGRDIGSGVTIFRDDNGDVVSVMVLGISRLTGLGKHATTLPLNVNVSLAIDLPEPEEDQLERLAAENPELVAKCKAMAAERERERVLAVAEERAEYETSRSDDRNADSSL